MTNMKNLFNIIAIAISINCISINTNAQSKTDKKWAALEVEINKVLKDHHAVGLSVAVVEKNKVVFAKGFGYRDFEKKLPATENTQYAIGSCTKAFTSALIGVLQKEKAIDLDKPFTEYYPDFKFYSNELTNQITLRDMMSHRTGLPRHDLSWYIDNDTREKLIKRIQYMEPSAPLRTRWQYNNFMFLMQGVLAEKLTNTSWESNVSSKILDKLGMRNTNFSIKDLAKYNEASLGYEVKKDSIIHQLGYYEIDGMGPAGSINSTVLDMAQWVKMWINGGKIDSTEILPASYITEAISSQMIISSALPTATKPDVHFSNYGFGWFLASYKGHYRVEHGGNIDGFSASTSFFPTDSIGIVVLANQNGSAIPSIVRNLIADKMLGLKYYDWNSDYLKEKNKAKQKQKELEDNASSNQIKNTKPSHDLNDYVGIYTNDAYGKFEIIKRGDSLFAKLKKEEWWLRNYHFDFFEPFETSEGIDTASKSPNKFQFVTGLKGDIEYALLNDYEPALSHPIKFIRKNAPKEISKSDLNKYIGVFILSGVEVKTYIKEDKLFVLVPGQPEYELVPTGLNKFDIKIAAGYGVNFELNEKQELVSLTFNQPNGNFKATIKK